MAKDNGIPQIKPDDALQPMQDVVIPEVKLDSKPEQLVKPNTPTTQQAVVKQATPQSTKKFSLGKIFKRNKIKVPKEKKPKSKRKKIILISLVSLGGLMLVLVLALAIPSFLIYKQAQGLIASGQVLKVAVTEEQDIEKIKQGMALVKSDLTKVKGKYKFLAWTKPIPFIGEYYKDGEAVIEAGFSGLDAGEIILTTVEPYADIIGFTAESSGPQSAEESANDRVEFIVETIEDIIPQLDEISSKVGVVQSQLARVNPNRYPSTLSGREIRSQLKEGLDLVDDGAQLIASSKPLLEVAPYLIGVDGKRTYMVIFQNDKELRPTGGFITAYSIMTVEAGKFKPVVSNDIYDLDGRYAPSIPAPDPIVDYIRGPYVLNKNSRLRDLNFNPDFGESMKEFVVAAEEAGIRDIDGIIAVDTQVILNLLEVIGEIGVPGYGNFSNEITSECNCPQVIFELESFADTEGPIIWDPLTGEILQAPPNYDRRKAIVGPLMNSVLANALGQPKDKLPDLFKAGFKSLTEKHVLFYMFDEKAQVGVESFNIAGRIRETQGDYLHINDANLGGRKSNLYVTQEVNQEIEIAKDGSVVKTVTITYKNPQDFDGWLNSVLPNWTRIYVPKGSELVDISGLDDVVEPYEELGKTVFAGGFELRPQGVVKVVVIYKLPFGVSDEYNLLVQKQPGTDNPLYTINVGKQSEELFLLTDKNFKFKI